MGAQLFERTGQRFDVAVGEMAGEVLFDRVSVVTACLLHRLAAVVGERDEDRAAVVFGDHTTDEVRRFEAVDDAGEAALAVEDLSARSFMRRPSGLSSRWTSAS